MIKYTYPGGNKVKSTIHIKDNFKHNPDKNKPAVTSYYESGELMIEENWNEGRKHGISRFYDIKGKLEAETHWYNGKLHNLNGPAVVSFYPNGKPKTQS